MISDGQGHIIKIVTNNYIDNVSELNPLIQLNSDQKLYRKYQVISFQIQIRPKKIYISLILDLKIEQLKNSDW